MKPYVKKKTSIEAALQEADKQRNMKNREILEDEIRARRDIEKYSGKPSFDPIKNTYRYYFEQAERFVQTKYRAKKISLLDSLPYNTFCAGKNISSLQTSDPASYVSEQLLGSDTLLSVFLLPSKNTLPVSGTRKTGFILYLNADQAGFFDFYLHFGSDSYYKNLLQYELPILCGTYKRKTVSIR